MLFERMATSRRDKIMFSWDLVYVVAGLSAIVFCFFNWNAIDGWWYRLPKSTRIVIYMLIVAFILLMAGKGMCGDIPNHQERAQQYPVLCWLAAIVAALAIGLFALSVFVPVRRRKPYQIVSIVDPEYRRVTNIVID